MKKLGKLLDPYLPTLALGACVPWSSALDIYGWVGLGLQVYQITSSVGVWIVLYYTLTKKKES